MPESDKSKTWYGVRTVYRWPDHNAYEDRIVLVLAHSLEEAIELGELEAREYEFELIEFIGITEAYATDIPEAGLAAGAEVFSTVRTSKLKPNAYLDRFFNTGKERLQEWNEKTAALPPTQQAEAKIHD